MKKLLTILALSTVFAASSCAPDDKKFNQEAAEHFDKAGYTIVPNTDLGNDGAGTSKSGEFLLWKKGDTTKVENRTQYSGKYTHDWIKTQVENIHQIDRMTNFSH